MNISIVDNIHNICRYGIGTKWSCNTWALNQQGEQKITKSLVAIFQDRPFLNPMISKKIISLLYQPFPIIGCLLLCGDSSLKCMSSVRKNSGIFNGYSIPALNFRMFNQETLYLWWRKYILWDWDPSININTF